MDQIIFKTEVINTPTHYFLIILILRNDICMVEIPHSAVYRMYLPNPCSATVSLFNWKLVMMGIFTPGIWNCCEWALPPYHTRDNSYPFTSTSMIQQVNNKSDSIPAPRMLIMHERKQILQVLSWVGMVSSKMLNREWKGRRKVT